jgi:predicted nucleic acid-binding OB-fold protein
LWWCRQLLFRGSSPKITYFDAFNRKIKEQHTGFDGRKIISDIHYDDLGRVKQASLPYFVANAVIMMREPCTLRFINTSNFANDIFSDGFLMS